MAETPKGYFTFVLHAHIPYVMGHGGWPHGTDWIYEAACETYIPLLNCFGRLADEGRAPKVTLGLSPVLCEQLADEQFKSGLLEYIDIKIKAASDNREEFARRGEAEAAELAERWARTYESLRRDFADRYGADIVGAFRSLQDAGVLEVITCGATHAYLPLVGRDETVRLQLRAGRAAHRRHFGRDPKGIWLPECAYRPPYRWRYPVAPFSDRDPFPRDGIERSLAAEGLEYFFVDTHLLRGGRALGTYAARFEGLKIILEQMGAERGFPADGASYSPHRPYAVGEPAAGATCFVRDPETGVVVWSGERGYPGDAWYLDFHKKHFPGGLRYWRVTSPKADLGAKELYRPAEVQARIDENADHFVALVKGIIAGERTEVPPVVVAPYDAELFGHWWFEGVRWLERVLELLADDAAVELRTAREYLEEHPPDTLVALPEGSWGEGGFHWIWLNPDTEWSWRLIYETEERLAALADRVNTVEQKRVWTQILREFMLLTASDWQFLISTWAARDYAEGRLEYHYDAARRLLDVSEKLAGGAALSPADEAYLSKLERVDHAFPDIDPSWFGP